MYPNNNKLEDRDIFGNSFEDHLFIALFSNSIEIRLCLFPDTAFPPSKLLCDVLWLIHLSLVR